jgi:hypothetical protein
VSGVLAAVGVLLHRAGVQGRRVVLTPQFMRVERVD